MPSPTTPDNLHERLFTKIQITPTCWLWIGNTHRNGYGSIKISQKMKLAHRVMYELFVSPIPLGLELDHLCRTRNCVNPEHLESVSRTENMLRGQKARTLPSFCSRGHEYTPENTSVALNPRRHRVCRTCKNARERAAWRARKYAA
jgi:hypothetical protein